MSLLYFDVDDRVKRLALLAVVGVGGMGLALALQKPLASQRSDALLPATAPRVFGAGVISTGDDESHACFSADGQTVYFVKHTPGGGSTIVVSRLENGAWTPPETVEFSGRHRDTDPFVTADGSRLYFASDRPVSPAEASPKPDFDLWVVARMGSLWSEPMNVRAPVNGSGNERHPTITASGTLYFASDRAGGKGRLDVWRATRVDGAYAEPENLGDAINALGDEGDPFIASDESFLVFAASRPEGVGESDLWISTKRNGSWSPARNLGDAINSTSADFAPSLSADGRTLFFTSTRGIVEEARANPDRAPGDIYEIHASQLPIEH